MFLNLSYYLVVNFTLEYLLEVSSENLQNSIRRTSCQAPIAQSLADNSILKSFDRSYNIITVYVPDFNGAIPRAREQKLTTALYTIDYPIMSFKNSHWISKDIDYINSFIIAPNGQQIFSEEFHRVNFAIKKVEPARAVHVLIFQIKNNHLVGVRANSQELLVDINAS